MSEGEEASSRARFKQDNKALTQLPLEILCHERTVQEWLSDLEGSALPLADKIRQIEERDLMPFLTGSPLRHEFGLHLDISDELDRLVVSRINAPLTAAELNPARGSGDGRIAPPRLETTPLVEVRDPRLLFSAFDLARGAKGDVERELAAQLFTLGRRVTTCHGVTTTWDQAVDRRVWATNIDTVYFLHALAHDGVFARTDVFSSLEIGVGGGHLSKAIVAKLASLHEHTATDINPHALFCAKRNLLPVLRPGLELNLFLGKGLRSVDVQVDLLLVNPPYIPHREHPDAVDPYRGTGLIKEVVEIGLSRLNMANPRAAIYLGMSSLAHRDLATYLADHPQVRAETLGKPREVPLKILAINENRDWIDFLHEHHGLVISEERACTTGFPFWHEITVVKLTPR